MSKQTQTNIYDLTKKSFKTTRAQLERQQLLKIIQKKPQKKWYLRSYCHQHFVICAFWRKPPPPRPNETKYRSAKCVNFGTQNKKEKMLLGCVVLKRTVGVVLKKTVGYLALSASCCLEELLFIISQPKNGKKESFPLEIQDDKSATCCVENLLSLQNRSNYPAIYFIADFYIFLCSLCGFISTYMLYGN